LPDFGECYVYSVTAHLPSYQRHWFLTDPALTYC